MESINSGISKIMNGSEAAPYEDITLHIDQIKLTSHNKYTMSDLSDLAASIMMDGLQEPLVVGKVDGEYLLCSGHRRAAAINMLKADGQTEIAEKVPCRYKEMTKLQFRLSLLIGNSFNRKLTDYDLMMQAAEWKEVLTQAKKEKLLVLESGERVRDYVAQALGESSGKIGQLEAINHNAVPEVKEQFKAGNMGITAAYEASKLDEEEQVEVAEEAEQKAQEPPEKKKKRKTKEDEVKEQNVSDTETTEEEKANAKKLHAVKMIEKYYLYLSDEETELLERILEDCKRRKREYALPED